MAMSLVLGETAMDPTIKMFSTYEVDYNWDRMETYTKRGKQAGDMFILKMGVPKRSKPIHDNWKINRKLFWMNDFTPKLKPVQSTCSYSRDGPFTEKEKKVCKKYLKTLESKMCMPPGLGEPLIWDNTRMLPRKRTPLPPVNYANKTKKSNTVHFKDKFFLEVNPKTDNHYIIHPEFRSEELKNQMKTDYWQEGSLFTEPMKSVKKKLKITEMAI